MQIFIFENVAELTSRYHTNGALVIVARDIEHVKEILAGPDYVDVHLDDSDITGAVVYDVKGKQDSRVFIFPDAGCC